MLKARLNALRTIAFSILLLTGSSTFAASPNIAVKSDPVATHLFSPLKMPRYEQWRKLSPKARDEFIQDVQAFLLRADAMARSGAKAKDSREAQIIQRLFDIWIETAEAKTKGKSSSKAQAPQQPYCINQGVVKPISECDTKLGYKMHDFDTNEKLGPLGDASQCQAPEKPCSPFFGFTAEGQMFCSSTNLTRDCKQKSDQEGTISLASTLAACEKGSPGKAKVDCGKLKAFFDEQMSAVDQLCKDAPKRFACGILKDQIQTVMAEKEGKAPAPSEAQTPDGSSGATSDADEKEVPAAADAIKSAIKMEASKAPCPPEQAAKPTAAAESKAIDQSRDNAKCPHKAYSQNIKVPVFDALSLAATSGVAKDSTCAEMDLPNGGNLKLDVASDVGQVRATSNSPTVEVDELGLTALVFASNFLAGDAFKVAPANLLAAYIPKESIKDAGKITIVSKDSKAKKEFPAQGLISTDGTQIRYTLTENEKKEDILLLTIKRPGDKETPMPLINLTQIQRGQEQARAAGSQKK